MKTYPIAQTRAGAYELIQHYDGGQEAEPLMSYTFDHEPRVGDIVRLYWEDGGPLGAVVVEWVDFVRREVHVRFALETVWGSI